MHFIVDNFLIKFYAVFSLDFFGNDFRFLLVYTKDKS